MFVAARKPARLLVLDMDRVRRWASLPARSTRDDMSLTIRTVSAFTLPSGEGFIFVYQQIDPERYERIARFPTAIGARTSAYTGEVGKPTASTWPFRRANRGGRIVGCTNSGLNDWDNSSRKHFLAGRALFRTPTIRRRD